MYGHAESFQTRSNIDVDNVDVDDDIAFARADTSQAESFQTRSNIDVDNVDVDSASLRSR